MGQLGFGQAFLALGFIVIVFLAGYAFRAALSRLRRLRGSRRRGRGRLFYASRREPGHALTETTIAGGHLTADTERLETDLTRLGKHVDTLRALYAEQQEMCGAARSDLTKATEHFRASVEQTQTLTKTLTERLDAAQRLQVEFEQMMSKLRKRTRGGDEEAVLPFKVRQRRLSEQK
jgi:hypothetical protein